MTHAFVVCAYGDSPYLEGCLRSLLKQTIKSDILLATSTPSAYLARLAKQYQIPLFVREGESGLKEDWRFALRVGGRRHTFVTLAHQDDRYHRDYTRELLAAYKKYPDLTVFASDYVVLKTCKKRLADGTFLPKKTQLICKDRVRFVKKLLRLPLRLHALADRSAVKRSVLCLGNSICCPSCTYRLLPDGKALFESGFSFALDWDNLWTLAGRPGRFIVSERPLVAYRIHAGAATKACLDSGRRESEEKTMFQKIWPEPFVRLLMYFYKRAYKEYE
ncbi:MAG: glycosyltransferase family 2 protein [Lachnospiraceae bacterium]|nr:glycosyltransferase family 2 protein [Lachnospiraceae bacterium]